MNSVSIPAMNLQMNLLNLIHGGKASPTFALIFIFHLIKTKGGEFLITLESLAVIKVLSRSDVLEHWEKRGISNLNQS
jgi:hypothetical protein